MRQTNIKTVIQDACNTIFKKTGCIARFFLTTTIQPPLQHIETITIYLPPTRAELQHFYQVHETSSEVQVITHLSFTMSEITELVFRYSLVNTLKQKNLWLKSDEIAAKKKAEVGFVDNSILDYAQDQKKVD